MAIQGLLYISDYPDGTPDGRDNTQAFMGAVAHLNQIGGGVLQLGSGDYRLNPVQPIVLDKLILRGAGMGATRIIVDNTLPANSAAFLMPSGSTGYTTGMEDLHLTGPGNKVLGKRTTFINGVEAAKKCFLHRVKVSNFQCGVNINGASHVQIMGCRLESNYYNLYFQRDAGDHTIFDSEFTGASMAGIGISGDKEGHSGTWIMRCHTGYSPYGIYQEPPSDPASKQGFFNGWTIDNLRFEGIGNAAMYTERWNVRDCGTVRKSSIKNVGFSWGSSYRLPDKPSDYAVYFGGVYDWMEYEPGDSPFSKQPGGLGVFRLQTNGAIWRGNFDYSDFTVGSDASANKGPLMPYSPKPASFSGTTSGTIILTELAEHGLGATNKPFRKIVLEFQNYANRSGSDQVIPLSCHLSKAPQLLFNSTALQAGTSLKFNSNREVRVNPGSGESAVYNGFVILYGY